MSTVISRVQLRGPRHLISVLDELDISTETSATYVLWMDEDFSVLHTQLVDVGAITITEPDTITANAILVLVDNHREFAALTDAMKPLQSHLAELTHVLDVIGIHNKSWRSLICSRDECCPPSGTPMEAVSTHFPLRAAIWAQWKAWIAIHQLSQANIALAVESLEDLTLRDAFLSELGHSPDFLESFKQFTQSHSDIAQSSAPWLAISASIEILENNRDRASELIGRALEINPKYSMAKLLQESIATNAPTELVVCAFTKYTSEELIQRAVNEIKISKNSEKQK